MELIQKWDGKLCPRINDLLKLKSVSVGNGEFEIFTVARTHKVDIKKRICTCRRWDMTGIPCLHGIAAIIIDNGDVEGCINECYYINTWLRV